jgi:hypothetical protein
VAGTGSGSALLVPASGRRVETRERVFERRAAPRVEYVQPGTMAWRGASWQLTVRDLSGSGVRVRIPDPQGCRLPAPRDNVRLDFPVDGGRVRVHARVAWRRPTPEGTEFGLLFATLSADEQDLIGGTCLARS